MIAEILCVGTEILLGDIVNTNTVFLSKELAKIGINVYNHSSVGDNFEKILSAIKIAFERADIVISTGGLGPTDDDITKEVFAKYFDKKLVTNEDAVSHIKKFYANRVMPKSNLKQAKLPDGCIMLENELGTAPAFIIEENEKIAIVLPGPPSEMQPLFKKKVLPYLLQKSDGVLLSKSLNLCGIGESSACELVDDLIKSATNPTIAPYADKGLVRFRLTAKAQNITLAQNLLNPMVKTLYEKFDKYIFSEDDKKMEDVLFEMLQKHNLTVATYETFTKGLLANTLAKNNNPLFVGGSVNNNFCKTTPIYKEDIFITNFDNEQNATLIAKKISDQYNCDIAIAINNIFESVDNSRCFVISFYIKNQPSFSKKITTSTNNLIEKAITLTLFELITLLKNI